MWTVSENRDRNRWKNTRRRDPRL